MKTSKLFIAAVAAISFGAAFSTSIAPASAVTKEEITKKNNDILSKIQTQDEKYSKLADQIGNKNTAIKAADKKITASKAKIEKLGTNIKAEKKELAARKEAMKKQLVSLQKEAGDSVTGSVFIDFLLNSKNLSDLISRGATVTKLNQANQDALQQVKDTKNKLSDLQDDQKTAEKTLEDTRATLVSDKAKLVSLQKDSKKESSKLTKMLADNKDVLAKLSADAAKKAEAAAKAEKAAAKVNTPKIVQTAAKTSNSGKSTPVAATQNNVADANKSYGSAIAAALSQQGKPYVWGAAGPSAYDCSGLVMWAYAKVGVSLPHSSAAQAQMGTRISISQLQPGDLVFWGSPVHHVGIYIGGGMFVHAPHTGSVVKTQSISGYTPDFGVRL
ncbi:NlpC/P60 family protein [Lacticaseibacillus sharpeae]|uniref:NlpC P60 family protein n=1 Tax=Lacticaseibacillus sharpeae JCM 1186 = DSM 20505 TaxID=1291052 RepID=A0A0R1ZSE0_9LACO|nr:NlpC/P60 family protein [Lacticaseibacillus sharpeae]KRM56116.1 nlpC P60 family protein [Lacticaseibacillus sharpeae JCM 1186 = DSM 20505]